MLVTKQQSIMVNSIRNRLDHKNEKYCVCAITMIKLLQMNLLFTSLFLSCLECTPKEAQDKGCMHGGTCFAIDTGNGRSINCHCTSEFVGRRCETQAVDPDLLESGH